MGIRGASQKGASVLAALLLVGIVGAAALMFRAATDSRSQTAQAVQYLDSGQQAQVGQTSGFTTGSNATASTGGSCSQSPEESQCIDGEVHTVDMTRGSNQCVQERGVKCFIKNAQGVMSPNPAAAGNPACASASPTSCVVRYCPPPDITSAQNLAAGSCIVIKCAQGDGANTCLRENSDLAAKATNASNYGALQLALNSQGNAGESTYVTAPPYNSAGTDALSVAYREQSAITQASDIITSQNESAACAGQHNCMVSIDGELARRAGLSCVGQSMESSDCVVQSQDALRQLDARNEELSAQMRSLQQQGIVYAGACPNGGIMNPQNGDCGIPNGGTQCPAGTGGTWPNCTLITGTVPGAGGTMPNVPGSLPQPGQRLTQDYYCVTQANPVVVVPVRAGSIYPSGCLNGQGGVQRYPTTIGAPTQIGNQTGFGSTLGGLFGGSSMPGQQNSAFYQLGRMIGGLFTGNGLGGSSAACATSQDQYYQQQQMYNQQMQQYQYQYQQYQYQQQQSLYMYGGYSSGVMQPQQPPPPPQPCYNNQNPQQCTNSPQRPPEGSCNSGTWKPTTSGQGCVSGWQCIPNGSTGTPTSPTENAKPIAELRCQPDIADVGMQLAISWGCQNSAASVGSGFDTNGAVSGSATATIQNPPGQTTRATYSLTCTKEGVTAGAQCSVQIAKPSIILVVNPKNVEKGKAASIGWITTGIKECLVSSPQMSTFTLENQNNTSANGVATTPLINSAVDIILRCTTQGGATREASTKIEVL